MPDSHTENPSRGSAIDPQAVIGNLIARLDRLEQRLHLLVQSLQPQGAPEITPAEERQSDVQTLRSFAWRLKKGDMPLNGHLHRVALPEMMEKIAARLEQARYPGEV